MASTHGTDGGRYAVAIAWCDRAALSSGTARISAPPSPQYRTWMMRSVKRVRWMSEGPIRSEEHTSELQSLMRISYAVFCLKKKKHNNIHATVSDTNN